MAPETRNLIAAMSLSLAILIGWQLYIVEPELQAERVTYEEQQIKPAIQVSARSRMLGQEKTQQKNWFRTVGSG